MFKKLLVLLALVASPVYAAEHMDLVIASYQNEDGTPVRFQHIYNHTLGVDWLKLSGINNIDLDDDYNKARLQIKPRLKARFWETNRFAFHVVNQFEYFETTRFDRTSNRVGVGTQYNAGTLSVEVNYMPYDSFDEVGRWDSYINYRFGKSGWGFNNQYWFVPETDQYYEQATLSYNVWKNVSVQVQRQIMHQQDRVDRIGFSMRFK